MATKISDNDVTWLSMMHGMGIDIPNRAIYLHGALSESNDEEPGVDWRMAAQVIKNLHFLEAKSSEQPITIHMMSYGGEWADGMAIYNAIAESPCYIEIVAYRAARSMTSIILQAADSRVLLPDAGMMLHYGHVSYGSMTGLEERTNANENARLNKRMLEIYASRMRRSGIHKGKRVPTIVSFLTKKIKDHSDWWMTSRQAIEQGLADEVRYP